MRIGFDEVNSAVSEEIGNVAIGVAILEGDFQGRISVNVTTSDGSARCKLTRILLYLLIYIFRWE